jgi:hypothetical protein
MATPTKKDDSTNLPPSIFATNEELKPENLKADLYGLAARYQMAAHRCPDHQELDELGWILSALSDPDYDRSHQREKFAGQCEDYCTKSRRGPRARHQEAEHLAEFIEPHVGLPAGELAEQSIMELRRRWPVLRRKYTDLPAIGEPWPNRDEVIDNVTLAVEETSLRTSDVEHLAIAIMRALGGRDPDKDPKNMFAHRNR